MSIFGFIATFAMSLLNKTLTACSISEHLLSSIK